MRFTYTALRNHLLEELLPLWRRHGIDAHHGGFHDRLDGNLEPMRDGRKRLLVQTRQLAVFSQAARMGAAHWALEIAHDGFCFLVESYWDAIHGGWYLTAGPDGRPLDRTKDLYAHAFVIYAMSHYHLASGNPAALGHAIDTWDVVRERLAHPGGEGFHEAASESWEPVTGIRRQNPHMHLLEALLVLHEAEPDSSHLVESERLVKLFLDRFFDRDAGCLGEFFDDAWNRADGDVGEVVEPGHLFEWVWLLHRYAAATGTPVCPEADDVFQFARRHGQDKDFGVFDQVDRHGKLLDGAKRLWPQTERIRALAARARTGDDRAEDEIHQALAYCFDRHVHPTHRGWYEHFERDGTLRSPIQNATSVYHVMGALRDAMASFESA